MKVIIISGFLGSGKTTFIQRFSKKLDNIAILENDYAKADIDSQFLKSDGSDVYSLDQGCICCGREADFATTLITIANGLKPDYLIIEPTGMGYLSRIIDNIKTVAYEQIQILGPITIVDYHALDHTLDQYKDLFLDQLKNASHILLSKIENLSHTEISLAVEKLKKHTNATIYTKHYSEFTDHEWKKILNEYDDSNLELAALNHFEFDDLVYENVEFKDFHSLGTALNVVSSGRFGRLIRGKGVIKVDGKLVKVDIVEQNFDVVKYDGPPLEKMIFIGEHLEKNAFDILFKEANT